MTSSGLSSRGALCAAALLASSCVIAMGSGPAGAGDCRWSLQLVEPRSQRQLLKVPLSPLDPVFSLSYTHSVFHTEVVSDYRIRAGEIVQVHETYTDPGYGMESSPADVKGRLELVDGRLRMDLDRPIANLVVRIQRDRNNRIAGLETFDLSGTLGDGAVLVRPVATCTSR